jgi:hypothetical protein
MNSPFGSINQQEVLYVLVHAGYAGLAAAITYIINSVGLIHMTGMIAALVTAALVPALVFAHKFFSGKAGTLPTSTNSDTTINA